MSFGHLKRLAVKSEDELYKYLGQGDTPKIYARKPRLDTSHTIAYCGGSSVDTETVYIDKEFYRALMLGNVSVRGMTAKQVVQALIEHEHAEVSIDVGDNDVDIYQPCHEYATAKEHQLVKSLGVTPERYEECLAPALKECLYRPQTNPPADLWCGPYLDHPDKHDLEILRQFCARGVRDAFKKSKYDVHYGTGPEQCCDCAMFEKRGSILSPCAIVSGLVRETRWCEKWRER
jgi:hypothetical protein